MEKKCHQRAPPPSARVLGQSLDWRLDKDVEKDFFFLSFFFHISKLIVNGRCGINGFSALSRGQIDAKTSDWVFFHSEDASPLNKSGREAPEGEISLAVT